MTAVGGLRMPCQRCSHLRHLNPTSDLCQPCQIADLDCRETDRIQDERRRSEHALNLYLGLVTA